VSGEHLAVDGVRGRRVQRPALHHGVLVAALDDVVAAHGDHAGGVGHCDGEGATGVAGAHQEVGVAAGGVDPEDLLAGDPVLSRPEPRVVGREPGLGRHLARRALAGGAADVGDQVLRDRGRDVTAPARHGGESTDG